MDWVIDCSSAAALFLPDESSLKVKTFISGLPENCSLWVPALWWYEMTNVLTVAQRRGRLSCLDASRIIPLFEEFSLNTDSTTGSQFSARIFELARVYQLSAYDATYLELAMRKNAGLVSLDNRLSEAAIKAGVSVLDSEA